MQGRRVLGKRVTLPCSHEGEVIVGQFAVCLTKGCDGLPGVRCANCGSKRVERFMAPGFPPDALHCWSCGRVHSPGV